MRTNALRAINSVALAIGRFSSVEDMLDYALEKVLEVVGTEAGSVYLLDEARGELKLGVHRGLSDEASRDFDHLKLGEGLSGRVVLTGEPIVLRNLKDDPRLTRMAARAEQFQAFASVPLRSNFKTYGTLNVHSRADRAFSEEEVQLLTSMASQIGLAVANTRLFFELRASERKFRRLVENAEDLIYLADPDGRIAYANPAFERLLGHSSRDVHAGRLTILSLIHPDDREEVASCLPHMLSGEVLRALEFRMVHADGARVRWFSQTTVPLRDESGGVTGVQCVAHDITERRQFREQIARAERMADLGRMAASIAHEIRNPLGAIVNSINVLRRSGAAAADQRLLDIVSEEADRLNTIIGEFLMFARPPARAAVPCEVATLVESTVELFQRARKGIDRLEVRVRCSADCPAIMVDPRQMREVLWNLLANAAEATSWTGTIDVDAQPADGGQMVAVSVTDNGPGVADVAAIFEPFYTTKPHGTGLGLAVVSRIVREHGGAIRVANVRGLGARFTIDLPSAVTGSEGA
ncbi:MAG: GAF domain-containing protein [Acidobacteria bacterium]|nr:GAF domain-containing protein [Acidobacteriota bacterium]